MNRLLGGKPDRVWVLGGLIATALLVAVTWFVLINPEHGQAADLRARTSAEQGKIVVLRHRLAELRQQNSRLAAYQAELARDQAALPSDGRLADFLRGIQAAGSATGVTVTGVAVGLPTAVVGDAKAYAMQVSVTADGTATAVTAFVDQMQRVQPRAVLITNCSTMLSTSPDVPAGTFTLTLTMQVFVAQMAGN